MGFQGPISGAISGPQKWSKTAVAELGLDSCSCYLTCASDIAIHMQLTVAEAHFEGIHAAEKYRVAVACCVSQLCYRYNTCTLTSSWPPLQ